MHISDLFLLDDKTIKMDFIGVDFDNQEHG